MPLSIVFIGLSITSSWGNGHATTYRSLLRALAARGHELIFLERDVPWYADHRDLPDPDYCRTILYRGLDRLKAGFSGLLREADAVVVGSYVPDGPAVARWALEAANGIAAFYDIDTPVTLAKLDRGECEYLSPDLVPEFDLYLSFTGGPTLRRLEELHGARCARALYCSVDPDEYYPEDLAPDWDLGYLGTYSPDRQPKLDELLIAPARAWPAGRFAVAGPQYPPELAWPGNVARVEHLPPSEHRGFYNRQRFTLNVTRADMVASGWSPSVRLFEAAACGVPIVSDWWPGLDELFEPGTEVLVAAAADEVLALLRELPEERRRAVGQAARRRVLAAHTAAHRAAEFERDIEEARNRKRNQQFTCQLSV